MRAISMLTASLLASTVPAAVSAQVYNTTTVGAPNYFGNYPTLVVPFYVTVAGNYSFLQSSSVIDAFLGIYVNFVNSADINENLIGADDDSGGGLNNSDALVIVPLSASQQYFAALGAFDEFEAGETTLTIEGPQAVTFGALPGAVPEPASWALMIGGFALAGGALRRRTMTVRFA